MPVDRNVPRSAEREDVVRARWHEDVVVPSVRGDRMRPYLPHVGPRGDRWNIKRRHQLQHFLVLCVDHTEKRGALGVGGRSKVERPQQTGRPGDEFHLCVICQVLPKREVPATRIAAPEPLASEEPAVPCCRRRSAAESELDTHLRGSSVSAPI